MKQLSELPPINQSIPVTIISSTYMEKYAPIKGDWFSLQEKWLSKNKNSTIFKVKSGHFIQLKHPYTVCEQIERTIKLSN